MALPHRDLLFKRGLRHFAAGDWLNKSTFSKPQPPKSFDFATDVHLTKGVPSEDLLSEDSSNRGTRMLSSTNLTRTNPPPLDRSLLTQIEIQASISLIKPKPIHHLVFKELVYCQCWQVFFMLNSSTIGTCEGLASLFARCKVVNTNSFLHHNQFHCNLLILVVFSSVCRHAPLSTCLHQ